MPLHSLILERRSMLHWEEDLPVLQVRSLLSVSEWGLNCHNSNGPPSFHADGKSSNVVLMDNKFKTT